ncbi:MAG: hypothetical protein HQK55_19490, partial [Deltaproteobacteria bacterium]|nr:hypothetical protein [Deltaproteobacteria bacterium]
LKEIRSLIDQGFFIMDKKIKPNVFPLDRDPIRAMIKLKKVDELTLRLPGKMCAACGAPDCRTLAEDVVLGKALLSDCPFFRGKEYHEEIL